MNIKDIAEKLNIANVSDKLNARALAVIAALAMPVVLLAVVMHAGAPAAHPAPHGGWHLTLEQARNNTRNRLAQLKKMTPADWRQERRIHPWAAANLQDALNWNTKRLAQLDKMTDAQWEAQFHPHPHPRLAMVPRPHPMPQMTPIPPTAQQQHPVSSTN